MFKITQQDYDVIVFLTRLVYYDGEMGECLYTFTEEDTQEIGNYFTELEIEFENGIRLSPDNPIVLAITEERICQHNRQYGRTIKMF